MKKDIAEDGLALKPRVFLASNGHDRGIPDVSHYGELVRLVERRIDPHLNFDTLRISIEDRLSDVSDNDYLLIGNCSLTLLLAFSYLYLCNINAKVLFYDQLTRDVQLYENIEGTWITKLTPMK